MKLNFYSTSGVMRLNSVQNFSGGARLTDGSQACVGPTWPKMVRT